MLARNWLHSRRSGSPGSSSTGSGASRSMEAVPPVSVMR
jgi:hypothetical protein